MDDPSIKLVARWQAGDQQAAHELFRRYADRLVALARSRLAAKLASRVEPEDVVQSAYRSFFAAAKQGRFDLHQAGDLWPLLVKLTLHKMHDQVKRHLAEKRTVDAEIGYGSEDSLHGLHPHLVAQEPSPMAAMALSEEVELIMRSLRPEERGIVEFRLQGYTLHEIAELTSRSVATVCRVLDRLKQRLQEGTTSGQTRGAHQ